MSQVFVCKVCRGTHAQFAELIQCYQERKSKEPLIVLPAPLGQIVMEARR